MSNHTWGPATVLLAALAVIVVVIGGVVVIVHPDTLSFQQYLNDLKAFALAIGGLAIGRGLHLGLTGGDDVAGTALVPHEGPVEPDAGDAGKP